MYIYIYIFILYIVFHVKNVKLYYYIFEIFLKSLNFFEELYFGFFQILCVCL